MSADIDTTDSVLDILQKRFDKGEDVDFGWKLLAELGIRMEVIFKDEKG